MKKWEYEEFRVCRDYEEKRNIEVLNELGSQGWELIKFTYGKTYGLFKREIVD